jgi:hypothetical protein
VNVASEALVAILADANIAIILQNNVRDMPVLSIFHSKPLLTSSMKVTAGTNALAVDVVDGKVEVEER